MKIIILITGLYFFSSVGSEISDNFVNESVQPVVESSSLFEQLSDPCKLSAEEVAKIMDWKDYTEPQSNPMNSNRMKSCSYGTNLSGAVSITYMAYKVRNPNSRYLERSFNSDLANTDSNMTYEAITEVAGDQMIYSHGKKGPNHHYKLRWRFGETMEKSIDFRSPKKGDAAINLEKLKSILAALNKG